MFWPDLWCAFLIMSGGHLSKRLRCRHAFACATKQEFTRPIFQSPTQPSPTVMKIAV